MKNSFGEKFVKQKTLSDNRFEKEGTAIFAGGLIGSCSIVAAMSSNNVLVGACSLAAAVFAKDKKKQIVMEIINKNITAMKYLQDK